MTNAEIQPALTPEQWEQRYIGDAAATDEAVSMGEGFDTVSFSGHQRHALAALCLYGQPFGFTHEDVNDERQAYVNAVHLARRAQDIGDETERLRLIEMARRHRERADRIAALLPPSPAHESTPSQVPGRPVPH